MDEEDYSKKLTIEEPYKKELALALRAMDYIFDEDSERESFIDLLNSSKCVEIVRKSKLNNIVFFPKYIFMQIGNYHKDLDTILEKDISEESFRNYLA